MSNTHTDSGVDWPPTFERHDPDDRTRHRGYKVTLARAFDDLETELRRIGVDDPDDYRYSFDADARKTDGRPYSRANPDDPSFVLRWRMDGDQFAIGCDAYSRLRDNVRTAGLYLREKRKMNDRPVATDASEFANARLPPGDADADMADATGRGDEDADAVAAHAAPHTVLGVQPDAPEEVVKAAARRLKATHHPDAGGSTEEFQRVVRAENAMLGGNR